MNKSTAIAVVRARGGQTESFTDSPQKLDQCNRPIDFCINVIMWHYFLPVISMQNKEIAKILVKRRRSKFFNFLLKFDPSYLRNLLLLLQTTCHMLNDTLISSLIQYNTMQCKRCRPYLRNIWNIGLVYNSEN